MVLDDPLAWRRSQNVHPLRSVYHRATRLRSKRLNELNREQLAIPSTTLSRSCGHILAHADPETECARDEREAQSKDHDYQTHHASRFSFADLRRG
jgi:hypothetical protein